MDDTISRQAAKNEIARFLGYLDEDMILRLQVALNRLPSAPPEITLESAIDYLHSVGWLQEHDRILTESAHQEIIRCKDCKWFRRWENTDITFCDLTETSVFEKDFCSRAERRTDE